MLNISICIPTYNQSAYLEHAVKSAFEQTLKPLEIIVFDDCSTDDTKLVLERLKLQIPILKVVYQPVNLGMAKNADACLRMGSGEFIVKLDSDDLLYPEYIEKVSSLIQKHPEAGYGHVAIQEIDQHHKNTKIRRLFRSYVYQDSFEALKAAAKGYKVAANIIMFRKTALEKVGYITAKVNFAEDWLLSIELAAAGYGNVYLNEILAAYRVWDDIGRTRQHRKLAEIKGIKGVFTQALEPAYAKKGWNLQDLDEQKSAFAAAQADCLGWDSYSLEQKQEITAALLQLSSSKKAKTMIWVYSNGFGILFSSYLKAKYSMKVLAKKLIAGVKSNSQTAS
jgi:glycosyltransferase involved in cell wall biosynthesis